VHELNKYLNALQGKPTNQHLVINLRLVQSLFHTQNFRRKTWDEATQTYTTKQYISLHGAKTLEDVLQGFGLAGEESLAYQKTLVCQMQEDVARFRHALLDQNLSKNTNKGRELTIINYIQPKAMIIDNFSKNAVLLNEMGYPADWD
jgi:hypothetical protein